MEQTKRTPKVELVAGKNQLELLDIPKTQTSLIVIANRIEVKIALALPPISSQKP